MQLGWWWSRITEVGRKTRKSVINPEDLRRQISINPGELETNIPLRESPRQKRVKESWRFLKEMILSIIPRYILGTGLISPSTGDVYFLDLVEHDWGSRRWGKGKQIHLFLFKEELGKLYSQLNCNSWKILQQIIKQIIYKLIECISR